ncbi:Crp/Fnr family transcriptional regulator [Eisenibacter elegans]|jgi:CRP-like cAMP-binding protein|uniref:Crp/Fnr family transcriptional regulator n=1 Tax=Eisenibacter elegans TaxID=997 RepID=UPI000409F8B7|nr:Crp/Fnr family transcriptional regulator [Eisenibacter elegans]
MTDLTNIQANISHLSPISTEEMALFFELGLLRKFKKNALVLRQGEDISPFMFIKRGCLMTYHEDEAGFKHVIQFGVAMWWTGDLQSMQDNTLSYYGIKAISPTEVYSFDQARFETLVSAAPGFERYFRLLFQKSLINHQKRIIRNISFSAEQRYEAFVSTFPKLEQLVPQKYVASYLGITPEFLSKMKARFYRQKD